MSQHHYPGIEAGHAPGQNQRIDPDPYQAYGSAIGRAELPRMDAADPMLIADFMSGVFMQRAFFTGWPDR